MTSTTVTIHDHASRIRIPFRELDDGSYFQDSVGNLCRKIKPFTHMTEDRPGFPHYNAIEVQDHVTRKFGGERLVLPQNITIILNDPTPPAQEIVRGSSGN